MDKRKIDQGTEQLILEAARKVFLTKGLMGARMQDIADEAGINKALLHYYFRNKQKLFETIFSELAQRFIPRLNEIFESDASLFQKIEMFCGAYISKINENPFIPLFVLNEINRPGTFVKNMWAGKKPMIGQLVQQIEDEARKGNIRSISADQLVMNMISLCVFPFLGKPMFQWTLSLNDTKYKQIIEERKKAVPEFIIESIRK